MLFVIKSINIKEINEQVWETLIMVQEALKKIENKQIFNNK